MSVFTKASESNELLVEVKPSTIKLHTSVKGFPQRGGSASIEVQGSIVIFGGADREQVHFQDLLVYKHQTGKQEDGKKSTLFEAVKAEGDVPMPRSGHSLVSYGKYVFLFGGIDYPEEAVYSDIYLLDTDSWEWSYIGESGIEISARNSHSLAILTSEHDGESVLVVYGGASPEKGTLDDTVYARLPPVETVDPKTFFIEWILLSSSTNPGEREMHSTTSLKNQMWISGGRDSENNFFHDIWVLSLIHDTDSAKNILQWAKLPDYYQLPGPRCAHGLTLLRSASHSSSEGTTGYLLVLYGGFSNEGIGDSIEYLKVDRLELDFLMHGCSHSQPSSSSSSVGGAVARWSVQSVEKSLGRRFAHATTQISTRFLSSLAVNDRYKPVLGNHMRIIEQKLATVVGDETVGVGKEDGSITAPEGISHIEAVGMLIFGGVDIEKDYGDIWLVIL